MKDAFNQLYLKIFSEPEHFIYPIIYIVVIFFSAFIAWWIFNFIIGKVERKYHDKPFLKNKYIFILIKKAGHYSILIFAGMGIIQLLKMPFVEKIFFAFLIILLSSITSSIINYLLPYFEQNFTSKTESMVDDIVVDLSKKFSGTIIYSLGIVLALDVLGLNIMPFVAGAGIIGIAIGFAAKDTLSNLIAGILLIIDRPFEIGDRIEVWCAPENSATWGDVMRIGLRATQIKTTDNIFIIIPNNEIMKRDIINYTSVTKEIRVRIPVGIAYEADTKKAKDAIVRICLELDWVMPEPAPKVVVKSFGDSAVNLEARVWISEPRRRIDTISYMTDRVKDEFQKEGIEIPYPKREIYIKKEC